MNNKAEKALLISESRSLPSHQLPLTGEGRASQGASGAPGCSTWSRGPSRLKLLGDANCKRAGELTK